MAAAPRHVLWAWAVFVCVASESTGLPVPSESILVAVAVATAAGDPHTPAIHTVVRAAAAGAVLGDNLGYLIGRNAGAALMQRYGPRLGLTITISAQTMSERMPSTSAACVPPPPAALRHSRKA